MKISFRHQAIQRKNSDACVVTEHPVDDEIIDFAVVKVTGRYPDARYATNKKCKEIVYVHDGTGKVSVDGKEYSISAGDVVLIDPGEKFYWEGKNLNLFISCTPAFTIAQHQIVD